MKRTFLWLGCCILAAGMALAQDATSSSPSGTQDQNTQTRTQSTTTQNNTVRGCLSGSPGNYTITDQNGTQWSVTGDDATLRNSIGQEVEVTMSQNQSSDTANQGSTTTRTTHTVKASQVTSLSTSCTAAGTGDNNANPANNPGNMSNPNANPGTTNPNTEPQSPRMMSMLMQQSMPPQSQNGTATQPQATPPVTSQTPANSTGPTTGTSSQTGANSQVGTSPANDSGMTESEANHDAQAARQGELNSNPQNGQTSGRGVNNQGVNNPSTTSPNAVPTSPNSATPSSNTPQSQADCRQNHPIYECQATDIPWATAGGGNNGTPNPPH